MTLEPGQKIGDYEVIAKLGAGGLGVVYEVQHRISQRREALKILLADQTNAPDLVERFHREVQTLATLNHVNICGLHTAFYYGNQLAMVMELVHGRTLRDLARRQLSLPELMFVATQVLEALVYAHQLGVVHRDIKPSNIMLTDDGAVKLLDFGIARSEKATDLTHSGYLVGSLSYMAPEQFSGHKATPRSDIYSLGVTLYELATGKLPITGATNYEIMKNHIEQSPAAPHEVAGYLPLALSESILKALEKDPLNRFGSAEEFLHVLQGIPVHIQPTPRPLMDGFRTVPGLPAAGPSGSTTRVGPRSSGSIGSGSAGSADSGSQPRASSGSGLQGLPLEEVSRKLAVYIGPVAKIVVKKLAAQTDDLDVIYREAAKQISSDADRAAFLRSRKQ